MIGNPNDFPDGVYYDIPEDTYHAIPRLSASGIKKLMVSSIDFWASSFLNPNKKESKKDAFNLGTAYHKRILEGDKAFRSSYAVPPDCDRRTKAGKEIYDVWDTENTSAKPIDQDEYNDIQEAANLIACGPFNGLVSDGQPEVSILWTDKATGVPMKSRIDYIKDSIVDLKTFSNSSDSDIERCIMRSFALYKYHLQAAVYFEAWKHTTFKQDPDFNFLFVKTGRPLVRAFQFKSYSLACQVGESAMRSGIEKFARCWETYGASPWYDPQTTSLITDEMLPMWLFD